MKIRNNDEYKILNALKEGLSMYQISKIFKVDKKKVKNIKENGKWYINLYTNELVFTSKKITIEEQVFYYLYNLLEKEQGKSNFSEFLKEESYIKERKISSTLKKKRLHLRVALWLVAGEEENINMMSSKCNYWLNKKEDKLVGYNLEFETINKEILELGEEFKKTEMEVFEKSYFYDEEVGYPRGYKLWFIDIYKRPQLLYHSLNWVKEYISFDGNDKTFKLLMIIRFYQEVKREFDYDISLFEFSKLNNEEKKIYIDKLKEYKKEKGIEAFFCRFNLKIAIELGKWGRSLLKKGYSIEEIYSRLERRCSFDNNNLIDRGTIDLTLLKDDVPRVIYIELGAYKDKTINEEMRKKVEETFIL